MAVNLAPPELDLEVKKQNQEAYSSYLAQQVANHSTTKAQTREQALAHGERLRESHRAWEESEAQRVAQAAARKKAVADALKKQMEEDRQRRQQAEWDRRGLDRATGVRTVKPSEKVALVEVPRLETLGVTVRAVPVQAAEAMTLNSKDPRFDALRHCMSTEKFVAMQSMRP